MKKDRLLNPLILREVAALGHTDYLCIGDSGLPVPEGVKVIDISVTAGLPRFLDVLRAVESELVVESYIIAEEIAEANPETQEKINEILPGKPAAMVPHEEFKHLTEHAKCMIRTGETSPYANIILVGGVNF